MRKAFVPVWLVCLLLTGCWDQHALKKILFVDIVGIDYVGGSRQLKVNFVISSLREANQGGGKPSATTYETTGVSLFDAVANTNKDVPGNLSALETRLYLISPEFAKDRPLNFLNSASQFLSNPLYAHLAVYDGDLPKLLSKNRINDVTVSDLLMGLLEGEIERGKIPSNKLLHYILGGTNFINDFALNRFEPKGEGARLAGLALFSEGRYTGSNLNNEEAQLANLMNGAEGKIQTIVGQLDGSHYSVLVQNAKRKFRIVHTDSDIDRIELSLKLDVKLVEEDTHLNKHTKDAFKRLEKSIETDLSAKATKVIATLQEANCDFFQLGHEVAAYYPKQYSKMNWREQYPKLSIKPAVKVNILNSGILE